MTSMTREISTSHATNVMDGLRISEPTYYELEEGPSFTIVVGNNRDDTKIAPPYNVRYLLSNAENLKQVIGSWISPANEIGALNLELLNQLLKIQDTPEDERWPDAKWPTPEAFEEAETFIQKIPLHLIPMPNMGLADDGEINFEWDHDGVTVDLGFYGEGTYSFFARGKDGKKEYGDDIPVSNDFPSKILNLFTA